MRRKIGDSAFLRSVFCNFCAQVARKVFTKHIKFTSLTFSQLRGVTEHEDATSIRSLVMTHFGDEPDDCDLDL